MGSRLAALRAGYQPKNIPPQITKSSFRCETIVNNFSTYTVLKGSPVKKTAQDVTLGTTEWTLANGVKVVVKPTTYKADEVRMSAVAKGGLSILSDEEFYMGEMMPAFNSMSGVGKFSAKMCIRDRPESRRSSRRANG